MNAQLKSVVIPATSNDNAASILKRRESLPRTLDAGFAAVGITTEKSEAAYLNLLCLVAIFQPEEITKADFRKMRTISESSEATVKSQLMQAAKVAKIIGAEAVCELVDSVRNDANCVGQKYSAAVDLLRAVRAKATEGDIKAATPEQVAGLQIAGTLAYTEQQAERAATKAAAKTRKAAAAKNKGTEGPSKAEPETAESEYKLMLAAFATLREKLQSMQVPEARKGAKNKALKFLADAREQVAILAK